MLWIEVFQGARDDGVDDDSHRKRISRTSDDVGNSGNSRDERAYNPKMKRLVHEISIRNQVIYLDPPMEFARASWFLQLHQWLGIVCNLRKLKASRYEMNINLDANEAELFSELVTLIGPLCVVLTLVACTLCIHTLRRVYGS